jgi:5'(3')-deoxyribonucleotidase
LLTKDGLVVILAKIAIDIDDTLYNFGEKIREEFFKMAIEYNDKELLKGAYAPHLEWRSLSDSLSDDIVREAIDRVHSHESIISQKPYEHCVETLWKLKNSGHDLIYISNRDSRCWASTTNWLIINEFPVDVHDNNVHCVTGSKEEYLIKCQYLIDDRPKTVANFVNDYTWQRSFGRFDESKQRKAFGLWFPYNQALTDLSNVYLAPTWLGIRYYLERKSLIV